MPENEEWWVRRGLERVESKIDLLIVSLNDKADRKSVDSIDARVDRLEEWRHGIDAERKASDNGLSRRLAILVALGTLLLVVVGLLPLVVK